MGLARAILLLVAIAPLARADDDTSRARAHFEIGNGMYRLGDYRGALREFAAGYELTHKPGFLINLGQTYRKLKDLPRARDMYQQYLAMTPFDDPARAQVNVVLRDIEDELRNQPRAPEPIPSPVPGLMVPPPPPAPTPTVVTATPPVKHRNKGMIAGGIVLSAVGLGFVAGGGGAAALANSLAQELNDLDARRGTFDSAKEDRYHLDRNLSYGLFGVGAALAVTGIVLVAVGAR